MWLSSSKQGCYFNTFDAFELPHCEEHDAWGAHNPINRAHFTQISLLEEVEHVPHHIRVLCETERGTREQDRTNILAVRDVAKVGRIAMTSALQPKVHLPLRQAGIKHSETKVPSVKRNKVTFMKIRF